jgi:hypothetical protein
MEHIGMFYGHLVYFTAIWYILWPFSLLFVVIWYIFPRLVMLYQEKSGNPGCGCWATFCSESTDRANE